MIGHKPFGQLVHKREVEERRELREGYTPAQIASNIAKRVLERHRIVGEMDDADFIEERIHGR